MPSPATLESQVSTTGLQPLTKVTMAERLAVILTRFIVLEGLQEGDQLPAERDLAATMGVSHRVIREALGILVGQGIVVKEHGRGAFVRAFDREQAMARLSSPVLDGTDPNALRETRCAIEIGMMPVVVKHATEEDLLDLQQLVDAMQEKGKQGLTSAAEDLAFHQLLLRATHNETLRGFGQLIADSLRLNLMDDPGLLHRSTQEVSPVVLAHQAIVDAIRVRDAQKATQAMAAHLERTLNAQ